MINVRAKNCSLPIATRFKFFTTLLNENLLIRKNFLSKFLNKENHLPKSFSYLVHSDIDNF